MNDAEQRYFPFERFTVLGTVFSEAGMAALRPAAGSYAPAVLRLVQQARLGGESNSAPSASPFDGVKRELEALRALATTGHSDRFWHTSELVYQRVIDALGATLSAAWRELYVLSGWGEPPGQAGFVLQLQFPNGNILRRDFGQLGQSTQAPDAAGWAVVVYEEGSVATQLLGVQALAWLLGICRLVVHTSDRLRDTWPALLDVDLATIGPALAFGPQAVFVMPHLANTPEQLELLLDIG